MKLEKQIPVVSGISKVDFQNDFVIPQIPVVLKNAVSDWPAIEKWTPEYLNENLGSQSLSLKKSETFKHPDINQKNPGATDKLTFTEYLNKTVYSTNEEERKKYYVSGDENFFFSEGRTNPAFDSIADDYKVPSVLDENRLRQISFWLSVRGVLSWLHFDGNGYHNVNVQVAGSKKVQLINPLEANKLYPFSFRETIHGFNFSKVDVLDYDETLYPLFRDVSYQETVLEKGDMLFIPSVWFHAIHHLGDVNLNVNFWWQPKTVQMSSSLMRSKLLKMSDQAYLSKAVEKYDDPKWDNWCKDEKQVAEFLFQCDEYFLRSDINDH